MTNEEAKRYKFPTWIPFAFSVLVVAAGAFASWYGLQADVAAQDQRHQASVDLQDQAHAALLGRVASLESKHAADTSVAVRLARVEDSVNQIGAALKVPGFPKLNKGH